MKCQHAINPAFVPAITKTGTTAKNTEAVKNILLSLTITGFLSTVLPNTSKTLTNFGRSANATIPVSRLLIRNAFGLAISTPLRILTLLLTLLSLPSLLPPLNLIHAFPIGLFFPSNVPLDFCASLLLRGLFINSYIMPIFLLTYLFSYDKITVYIKCL